jgi:hypothetical protein
VALATTPAKRSRWARPTNTGTERPDPAAQANCSCEGFSSGGVVAVIILLLFFCPLFWIPLVTDGCFEQTQRPVYDNDGGQPGPPVGAVHEAPPYYQAQLPAQSQGQPAHPYQGAPQYQQGAGPPGAAPPGAMQGGPAHGEPLSVDGKASVFPDPVKPPKTVA